MLGCCQAACGARKRTEINATPLPIGTRDRIDRIGGGVQGNLLGYPNDSTFPYESFRSSESSRQAEPDDCLGERVCTRTPSLESSLFNLLRDVLVGNFLRHLRILSGCSVYNILK